MYGAWASAHQSLARVIASGVQLGLFFKFTDCTAKCHLCENDLPIRHKLPTGLLYFWNISEA